MINAPVRRRKKGRANKMSVRPFAGSKPDTDEL